MSVIKWNYTGKTLFEELIAKLENKKYVTLETTPSHSPVFQPIIDKIKNLELDKLVDGFSTTDNPLAKLKYNAILAAIKLQSEFNKPVLKIGVFKIINPPNI